MVYLKKSQFSLDMDLGFFLIFRRKVVDFLDLTLLEDFVYVNIVLGISFALYSDTSFFTIQPMYLFELGFAKVNSRENLQITGIYTEPECVSHKILQKMKW